MQTQANTQAGIPPVSFQTGNSYRLFSSPDFPQYLRGFITIRTEIKPRDPTWGNRILLADLILDDGRRVNGLRCFVECGYRKIADSYGERLVSAEIATLQGVYPSFGKSYATDSVSIAGKEVA